MSNSVHDEILLKLTDIQNRLIIIEQKLNICTTSCENMDDHITFVNGTYSLLKAPIEYVSSKFARTKIALPSINDAN